MSYLPRHGAKLDLHCPDKLMGRPYSLLPPVGGFWHYVVQIKLSAGNNKLHLLHFWLLYKYRRPGQSQLFYFYELPIRLLIWICWYFIELILWSISYNSQIFLGNVWCFKTAMFPIVFYIHCQVGIQIF